MITRRIPIAARLPLGCILLTFAFGLIRSGITGQLDEVQAELELAAQEIAADRAALASLSPATDGPEMAADESGTQ